MRYPEPIRATAIKIRSRADWPTLQMGQRWRFQASISRFAVSESHVRRAASRVRHSSSLICGTRLARKPNWRMRTRPVGSTCSRKRRRNSIASSVMSLRAGAVSIIFPLEADAPVFERTQAMVGDRDAMRVASQILEHAARPAEGRLDVHHPVDGGGMIA